MSEKLKSSRYNHFIKLDNGNRLAFNAISCGLGEMDEENYKKYTRLANGNGGKCPVDSEKLLEDLKKGGFLIPEDVDELDALRAGHYMARFGNNGFGLTIIPTVNCNFACDYCYEDSKLHSLPVKDGSVMSDEVCDNIVKLCENNIEKKSAFAVTWYGGEPMLAKNVIGKLSKKFIKICESKESQYHAGMITNGYLLNKKNIDFLIKNKVTFLQITVDGPKEVHDQRRPLKSGKGTYNKIMENISFITEDMPISISIRINVDKRNKGNYHKLLEDFKSRNFHKKKNTSTYFGHVVRYNKSCPDFASQCMVTEQFSDFLVEANQYAIEQGFRVSIYPNISINTCGAVTSGGVVVEPNGQIQNCWNTIGNDKAKTGKVTDNGIEYNNNYMKWLGWTPFIEKCNTCDVLPICMGGCPYKSIYNQELPDDDVQCTSWKYNIRNMLPVIKEAKTQNLLIGLKNSQKGGE